MYRSSSLTLWYRRPQRSRAKPRRTSTLATGNVRGVTVYFSRSSSRGLRLVRRFVSETIRYVPSIDVTKNRLFFKCIYFFTVRKHVTKHDWVFVFASSAFMVIRTTRSKTFSRVRIRSCRCREPIRLQRQTFWSSCPEDPRLSVRSDLTFNSIKYSYSCSVSDRCIAGFETPPISVNVFTISKRSLSSYIIAR